MLSPLASLTMTTLRQWTAFSRDLAVATPPFEKVIADLAAFLVPNADAARLLLQPKQS